jgi:Fic family protein
MIIPTQVPISPLTLSLISGIHELKGALRTASHMAPERMLALRQVATLESVASGLRLGNVVLSDTEVRRVLARHHGANQSANGAAIPSAGSESVAGSTEAISGQKSPASGHLLPFGPAMLDDLVAEPLADHEVDELLLAHQEEAGVLNSDEQQALGYYEALSRVLALVPTGRLTEDDVNDLHRVLLGHSVKDGWHVGKYKVSANNPLITHPESGTAVALQSTPPANVGDQMAALLAWLARERSEPTLHPLLTVTIFTACFMAMRPYQDGNGRMARLLARLLLLQAGYSHVAYGSLEAVLENDRDNFYRALNRTLVGMDSGNPHWEPWIGFFLSSLAEQVRRLYSKLEREKQIFSALPKFSSAIVDLAREHGRVTMADAIRLTGSNRNTLKLHFRKLVHQGQLQRHGMGAGVWYQPR